MRTFLSSNELVLMRSYSDSSSIEVTSKGLFGGSLLSFLKGNISSVLSICMLKWWKVVVLDASYPSMNVAAALLCTGNRICPTTMFSYSTLPKSSYSASSLSKVNAFEYDLLRAVLESPSGWMILAGVDLR